MVIRPRTVITAVVQETRITAWLETERGDQIPVQEECRFGREEAGNDVILRSSMVSRHHAVIQQTEREFWLTDLESINGVLVNGLRVRGPVRLLGDDRLEMPTAKFTFRLATKPMPIAAKVEEAPRSSPVTEAKPEMAEPLPEDQEPALEWTRPDKKWLIGIAAGLLLAGVAYYFTVVIPESKVVRIDAPLPTPPVLSPVLPRPWINSLRMKFLPAGTPNVLFSIWEVRVRDYQTYVEATHPPPNGGIFVTKTKTQADGSPALGFERNPDASWKNPGFDLEQGNTDPVVGVNWYEAEAFCQWLTQREHANGKLAANREYRLPTDAEWSRAAGEKKYPWGDAWPPPNEAGNYADQALASSLPGTGWARLMLPENDGYSRTSPVGSFRANAYGLYDMGGNVWQWCEDWYQATMNSAEVLQKLPSLSNDDGGHACKVLRGASWDDYRPEYLLSSCRSYDYPDVGYADRGFRVVVADAP